MTVVLLVMKTNCFYRCVFDEYNSVCDGIAFFIFQECGNRRTLPFCQYVDGPHIIFGCLFYHASFCKYISFYYYCLQIESYFTWIIIIFKIHL